MKYAFESKYPEVKVEEENKYYATLLLEDYAGINSELTAITQYVYQDFDLFKEYPEVSEALARIAVIEMRHLELLGKTIKLLGIKPEYKYQSNYPPCIKFWNSSFVNYDTYIIYALNSNIIQEEIAIKNYKYHLNIINDKYVKELIRRIILDEEVHIECFKKLLQGFIK